MARSRRGQGQWIEARDLQTGDVLARNGWTVLGVDGIEDDRVRVSFTSRAGLPRTKTYDAGDRVEVIRTA
jgi:hypothetical protein